MRFFKRIIAITLSSIMINHYPPANPFRYISVGDKADFFLFKTTREFLHIIYIYKIKGVWYREEHYLL